MCHIFPVTRIPNRTRYKKHITQVISFLLLIRPWCHMHVGEAAHAINWNLSFHPDMDRYHKLLHYIQTYTDGNAITAADIIQRVILFSPFIGQRIEQFKYFRCYFLEPFFKDSEGYNPYTYIVLKIVMAGNRTIQIFPKIFS